MKIEALLRLWLLILMRFVGDAVGAISFTMVMPGEDDGVNVVLVSSGVGRGIVCLTAFCILATGWAEAEALLLKVCCCCCCCCCCCGC